MKVLLLGPDEDRATLAAGLGHTLEWVDVPSAQLEQHLQAGPDAIVLIVSVLDGIMPVHRQHLELVRKARAARRENVQVAAIYLSRCDMVEDEEMQDLVVMEVHELLDTTSVGSDATPVARDVQGLLQALGATVPAGESSPAAHAVLAEALAAGGGSAALAGTAPSTDPVQDAFDALLQDEPDMPAPRAPPAPSAPNEAPRSALAGPFAQEGSALAGPFANQANPPGPAAQRGNPWVIVSVALALAVVALAGLLLAR